MAKQLPNGACHSILFKLTLAILRQESSEALRRRYGPGVPSTILQFLLLDEQDGDDMDLQKINRERAELARANFSILRKEAQSILDLDGGHSLEPLQRAYILEAELALLLRISHKYQKSEAKVLFSMGALEHIASCKAVNFLGGLRWVDTKHQRDVPLDIKKQMNMNFLRTSEEPY